MAQQMIRTAHRITGAALGVFILLHLANHVTLFWGTAAHQAAQDALRMIYRNPVIEPLLLAGFMLQICLGLRLLWWRGWPARIWPRVQTVSGGVLAFFLIQHIGAVLFTRYAKPAVDTDIFWAASVVSRPSFTLYFMPYYALGLTALFVHLAAVLSRNPARRETGKAVAIIGSAFAVIFVVTLAGGFFDIPLPAVNKAYLDTFPY